MNSPSHKAQFPRLEFRDATRVFTSGDHQVRAVDAVTFSVAPGEFLAIMGASGSGKSTLLHLAGGLDQPTSGDVLIDGHSLPALSAAHLAQLRRTTVGYVFQDFNLLPALSAEENVAFPLELDGVPWKKAQKAAREALEAVGVGELAPRRPAHMSGGQAQRVAIARALIGTRTLLLADEPTGALDSVTSLNVVEILRERADGGTSVVLVTHDARLAAWADRTIHLQDGHLVGSSAAEDFTCAP